MEEEGYQFDEVVGRGSSAALPVLDGSFGDVRQVGERLLRQSRFGAEFFNRHQPFASQYSWRRLNM